MSVQEIKHYRFGCTNKQEINEGTSEGPDGTTILNKVVKNCTSVSHVVQGVGELEAAMTLEPYGWYVPLRPSLVTGAGVNRIIDEIKCPSCMQVGRRSNNPEAVEWGEDIKVPPMPKPAEPVYEDQYNKGTKRRRFFGRKSA